MAAKMVRISIALAAYQGARFLPEQLASLAGQTLLPSELVVLDDGSDDETCTIIEQFAASAPFPVQLIRNERRLGYRENFMRAAAACSGDLIAFCDQDDIWAPEKLARSAAPFHDPAVVLAYHNARLTDPLGKQGGHIFPPREKDAILTHEDIEPWRIVPGFSQTIRRSLLRFSDLHQQSEDMFDLSERMPHDQWFLFLATALGKTAYLSEPLAQYRQHDSNTSGWLPARPIAFALHNIAYASYYVRSTHKAVENRIELLHKIKAVLPSTEQAQIDKVITHYQHIRDHVGRRLALYTEKSVRVRIRLLLSMIRNRTYSDSKVKFGRGSFLLDTAIGVPVGHTLR